MAKRETDRNSRRRQRREDAAKQRRRQMLLLLIPVVLVVGFVTFLLIREFSPIEGVVSYGNQDRTHDTEALYPFTPLPPVGGAHQPIWQNCGIYDQPIEVALALHSMEHGAVWIAYQPELPNDQLRELRDLAGAQPLVLLTPYPGLARPVIVSAWGVQLQLDNADDARLEQFVNRYRGQGPEIGATCAGGVGSPIG